MGLEAVIIGSLIGAGASVYQAERAASSQRRAQEQAQRNMERAERQQEEARNRANQRRPDTRSLLADARAGGQAGLGSTFLTGPGGVDPDTLLLNRTSLLGS